MSTTHKCDYVDQDTGFVCGRDMDDYGEYLQCNTDGNKKHIIVVDPSWDEIVDKPSGIDNAIYTVLQMKLKAKDTLPLDTENTQSNVKSVLNNIILTPATSDYSDSSTRISINNAIKEKFPSSSTDDGTSTYPSLVELMAELSRKGYDVSSFNTYEDIMRIYGLSNSHKIVDLLKEVIRED